MSRNGEHAPPTPRWVKRTLIVVGALVMLVVVALLVGGTDHGPGRHGGSHDSPPAVTTEGHTPPPGIDHGAP